MQETTDLYQKETFLKANKKNILNTAAALLGGSALVWSMKSTGTNSEAIVDVTQPVDTDQNILLSNGFSLTPNEDIIIAKVSADCSFEDAFDQARVQTGPGGIFVWNDKVYNTYEKNEWNQLSLKQRQEFLKDCGYQVESDAENSVKNETKGTTNEPAATIQNEPIYIETFDKNGNSVISVDKDRDGVVDYILTTDGNGNNYLLVDSTNDNTLDSIYQFWPNSDSQPVLVHTFSPVLVSTNDMMLEKENQIEQFILAEYEKAEAIIKQQEQVEPIDEVSSTDNTEIVGDYDANDGTERSELTEDYSEESNYNGKMHEMDSSDF